MRKLTFRDAEEQRIVEAMARAKCIANGEDPYEDPDNKSESIIHWRAYFEYYALLQFRAHQAMVEAMCSSASPAEPGLKSASDDDSQHGTAEA